MTLEINLNQQKIKIGITKYNSFVFFRRIVILFFKKLLFQLISASNVILFARKSFFQLISASIAAARGKLFAENQLPLGDECYILILNTSCDATKVPENLKTLYAYINNPEDTSDDVLMEKIDDQVTRYSGSEWRWVQVTFEEHVKHMAYLAKEEGKAEGMKEGKAEGIAHGRRQEKQSIAAKLKALGMAVSEIKEITGLSLDEIETLD